MGVLANDMNAYVMGFFLSLSIINVWENTNTLLSRRMKLDALQWASATSQLMNLILHFILNTAQNLSCDHALNAETLFFYFFQLGSGFVITYRATAIIPNRRQQILIRYGLALLLAVSVGLNISSDILRTVLIIDGTCVPIFDRLFNDVSKIVLAVLYSGLLVAFTVPMIKGIKRAGRLVDTSAIRNVTTITAIKIIFAIVVLVVTVVLSLVGVFGEYFWIQFTIQNYSMIWASTVASRNTSAKENDSGISLTSLSKRAASSRATTRKGFSQFNDEIV